MGHGSRTGLVHVLLFGVLVGLLVPREADARKVRKRTQPKKQTVTVEIEDPGDPEELREEIRRASKGGTVRIVVRPVSLQGPVPLSAPTLRESQITATGYRPQDVAISDPSYDGFPSNFHAEPSIAAQGSSIACVFNDGGADASSSNPATFTNSDGFSISTDGGATFRDQGKRSPPTGLTSFLGDNVVASGPDGDFYTLSDAGAGNVSYNVMAVSRSTNGGRTWSAAANAAAGISHRFTDGFFDKGWIAVDRTSGATRGNLYVTWSDFSFKGGATDLYVSRSTDRGLTWSAQSLDSFSHPVAVTYVQVASNGLVYVGEQDEGTVAEGTFTGTNYARVSLNGGVTWSSLLTVGPYRSVGEARATQLCGNPAFFGGLIRYLNGPIETDSSLRIAVDPTDAAGRTVFVATQAIPDDRPGDPSDIFLWRTTDGGGSWSPPVRVNDDRTRTAQFMPDLWVANDGTLGVMWLDRRNDPTADWRLETWMAISRDHGRSFGCSFPVSSQAFPPVGHCQMSDYNGVFADDAFHLAWGDGRQVDSQRQTTFAIVGATVPLEGPGPILSLDPSQAPTFANGTFTVRVRNDGLAPATDLFGIISIEGNTNLPPLAVMSFPDVPGCHGTVEGSINVPFAVTTPYLRANLTLFGPLGTVMLPFSLRLPTSPLGTLLEADFEDGSPAVFTPATGSLWHITGTCPAGAAGHSGSRVAYFGLDSGCNYNVTSGTSSVRVFGSLTSRVISVPPGTTLLTFNEWVGLPSRWPSDHAGLQISTDGGLSFENLWGYGKMSRYSLDPAVPLTDSVGSPTWHRVALDVSDHAGHDVVLRFFFNGIGKASPGYAVDDVTLVSISSDVLSGLGTCDDPLVIASTGPFPLDLRVNDEAARKTGTEPASCGQATPHPLWLEFTPPVTGTYTVGSTGCDAGAPAPGVSVFSGDTCGPYELVACGSPCGDPAPVSFTAQGGVPLRFLATADATGSGTLGLTIDAHAKTTLIPVVLDVHSPYAAYTTEVALANPDERDALVSLTYTASMGQGSGTVSLVVPARRQIVFADMLAELRSRGLQIPPGATAPQAGSLLVTSASHTILATARTLSPTAAPLPAGRASLAYSGVAALAAPLRSATLFGLRDDAADRSKVAVFSLTAVPVTVRITALSGSGKSAIVREAETLPAFGWLQIENVLSGVGFTSGFVTVERTSLAGAFGAYGVINDNVTSDGSYVKAVPTGTRSPRLTVPAVVETARFKSELVLANAGVSPATLRLSYRESLAPSLGPGGAFTLTLGPGEQRIIPGALAYLRSQGVDIGRAGYADYAGALRITLEGSSPAEVFAGARTAAPAAAGGQLGVFMPAVPSGGEASDSASLYGLLSGDDTRTNVAIVNAGTDSDGPVDLLLTIYDGDSGTARGTPRRITLEPGQWAQPYGFFASAGISQGWVIVTRLSGSAPWLAYAVVNDGRLPGQRTDDGAYIEMRR